MMAYDLSRPFGEVSEITFEETDITPTFAAFERDIWDTLSRDPRFSDVSGLPNSYSEQQELDSPDDSAWKDLINRDECCD